MIPKEKLREWRDLADDTSMVSALGEYTPPEFIELLDAYEELARGQAATDLALGQVYRMFTPSLVGTPGLKNEIAKMRDKIALAEACHESRGGA